jgi:hypothetical protein
MATISTGDALLNCLTKHQRELLMQQAQCQDELYNVPSHTHQIIRRDDMASYDPRLQAGQAFGNALGGALGSAAPGTLFTTATTGTADWSDTVTATDWDANTVAQMGVSQRQAECKPRFKFHRVNDVVREGELKEEPLDDLRKEMSAWLEDK